MKRWNKPHLPPLIQPHDRTQLLKIAPNFVFLSKLVAGGNLRLGEYVGKLICVIGNKGGTGKTSITHMLCHGFGLLGMRSIAVLTDTSREPLFRHT
ncbi:MAG: hypothetical protein B7Y56_15615 [Gallionellales bacterium 35-53-114]|nr:MAG: hypothetical protein B7Y56_15615 [Gallionellales bacterium 35-53-114]